MGMPLFRVILVFLRASANQSLPNRPTHFADFMLAEENRTQCVDGGIGLAFSVCCILRGLINQRRLWWWNLPMVPLVVMPWRGRVHARSIRNREKLGTGLARLMIWTRPSHGMLPVRLDICWIFVPPQGLHMFNDLAFRRYLSHGSSIRSFLKKRKS